MFTRKRWIPPILTKDWERDGPNLLRSINEYLLSLEAPESLEITQLANQAEITTPTVTSGSGTFTTVAGEVHAHRFGSRVMFDCTVVITTNGTAAGNVIVPLPYTPAYLAGCGGVEVTTDDTLAGTIHTDGNLYITTYTGAYPGADGYVLLMSGVYTT